ncbi:MAG: hypothetical protein ACI8XG_000088 [Congregibacter sp.]|jgi:hypothetical protein
MAYKKSSKLRQSGFGYIEVFILSAIIAGIAASVFSLSEQSANIKQPQQWLQLAEQKLISFAALEGRLPCPDTTGNGVENCSAVAAKGQLPYITLGMTETGFDRTDNGLRYGVYIKPNVGVNDADLTKMLNRYDPIKADATTTTYDFGNINTIDFCVALSNGDIATQSNAYLYVHTPSNARVNIAFALAYSGNNDTDSANGLFDGLNGSSSTGFNSAGTPITADYDDVVRTKSFREFAQNLKCNSVINSLNLMATAIQTYDEVNEQIGDMSATATLGSAVNGVKVLVNVAIGVVAASGLTSAISELVVASSALTSAIASCALVVGCAFIPVYTTAVSLATAGIVASSAGVALVAAAVISQAIATGLYIDIAVRAGIAADGTTADYSTLITIMSEERDNAIIERDVAQKNATLSQTNANNALASAQNTLNNLVAFAVAQDDPANSNNPSAQNLYTTMLAAQAAINLERQRNQENTIAEGNVTAQIINMYAGVVDFGVIPEFEPSGGTVVPIAIQTVIVVAVCGNPDLRIASCDELDTIRSDAATALANWNTQLANVVTAYNTARTAGTNYLFYFADDPSTSTGSPDPVNISCGDLYGSFCYIPNWVRVALGDPVYPLELTASQANDKGFISDGDYSLGNYSLNENNMFVVPQLTNSYMDYSAKQIIADIYAADLQAKRTAVDAASNTIAAFTCFADPEGDGLVDGLGALDPPDYLSSFDETTRICSEVTAGNQAPGSFASSPLGILDSADKEGVAQ